MESKKPSTELRLLLPAATITRYRYVYTNCRNAIDRPLRRTLVLQMLGAAASHKVKRQKVTKVIVQAPYVYLLS